MFGRKRKLSEILPNKKGATAVEYGLIMALMTVAMVGALSSTGSATKDKWEGVAEKVENAST